MPSCGVAGTCIAFVEDIEIKKPVSMHWLSTEIDMGMQAIFSLDDGYSVPVITCITIACLVSRFAIGLEMQVKSIETANGTTTPLKVPAPGISFIREWFARNSDMKPAIFCLHCCPSFVETEGANVSFCIDSLTKRSDMVGSRGIPNWS